MKQKLLAVSLGAVSSALSLSVVAEDDISVKNDFFSLEEIIVTAERRSVSIQDIPVAVNAFGGEELKDAGITDPVALNKLVSGLDFRSGTGSGVSLFIRGVGSTVQNGMATAANAFSLDGVFLTRPQGPEAMFYDIERIEVVKGPQGTLYGKNATAGAVNIITRKPDFEAVSGSASVSLSNFNGVQGDGAINLPLNDTLALRAAINSVRRDGYFDDGYADADTLAGRVHLAWEMSDRFDLLLSFDSASVQGKGTGYIPLGPDAAGNMPTAFLGDPWAGPTAAAINDFVISQAALDDGTGDPRSLFASAASPNGFVDNNIWGASATLNGHFAEAEWTTIVGYRDIDNSSLGHSSWQATYAEFTSEELTVESRIASTAALGGKMDWILGVFYGTEDQSNSAWGESARLSPASPLFPADTDSDFIYFNAPSIEADTWAVFGQATYSLQDDLRLTLGARYTEDKKRVANGQQGFVDAPYATEFFDDLVIPAGMIAPFPITIAGGATPVAGEATFSDVSWNIGLEYDVGASSLLYANVRRGYHAGGLVQGDNVGPNPTSYDPEILTAYALGSKNTLLDDRLRLNAELYFWDYQDMHVSGLGLVNCGTCLPNPIVTVPQSALGLVVRNAGKAETYGLDVDGQFQLTPNDRFSFNLLLADGEYKEYDISDLTGSVASASGNQLINLPGLSATLGYSHSVALDNGQRITATLRTKYVGEREFAPLPFPGSKADSYTSTDLEVTWAAAEIDLRISAFVRNLEDDEVVASAFDSAESVTGVTWGTLLPPRTFGVTFSTAF